MYSHEQGLEGSAFGHRQTKFPVCRVWTETCLDRFNVSFLSSHTHPHRSRVYDTTACREAQAMTTSPRPIDRDEATHPRPQGPRVPGFEGLRRDMNTRNNSR